jgi:beta-galactosidase
VGAEKAFLACFDVPYEPGELLAVAYVAGEERRRAMLRTAGGPLRVAASADRAVIRADDTDLAYVAITVEDDAGNVACHRDRRVSVEVGGAGVLSGLGSARPWTEEPFGGTQCTTFDGRALAIVRPTGPGEIEIRVGAEGCETVAVAVRAAS